MCDLLLCINCAVFILIATKVPLSGERSNINNFKPNENIKEQ